MKTALAAGDPRPNGNLFGEAMARANEQLGELVRRLDQLDVTLRGMPKTWEGDQA